MEQIDTTIIELTSVLLQVRSHFASQGFSVKIRKKAKDSFTTSPPLPILIRELHAGHSPAGVRRDKIRFPQQPVPESVALNRGVDSEQ